MEAHRQTRAATGHTQLWELRLPLCEIAKDAGSPQGVFQKINCSKGVTGNLTSRRGCAVRGKVGRLGGHREAEVTEQTNSRALVSVAPEPGSIHQLSCAQL